VADFKAAERMENQSGVDKINASVGRRRSSSACGSGGDAKEEEAIIQSLFVKMQKVHRKC
jgi:hypothetical protein